MQANPIAPPWPPNPSTTFPVSSNVAPAFTTVSARRTLARETSAAPVYVPPAPPTAPPPPPKKVDWSPAVREYVQRSFLPQHAVDGISRSEIEDKLKQVISAAAARGELDSTDWDNTALPHTLILQEKRQAYTAQIAPQPTWPSPSPQPQSKKRKSSEDIAPVRNVDEGAKTPPWRKTNSQNVFEERVSATNGFEGRVTRPTNDKRRRLDPQSKTPSKSQANNLEKRIQRFGDRSGWQSPGTGNSSRDESPLPDANLGPIVGRSEVLEKSYLRLTSAADPNKVRPLHVLEKTLELLKKKWRKENNYAYICDQFKSLRQDLTVQHIKTKFTVEVYEIHARIALEKGDMGEYNQCQAQLRGLYAESLGGHPMEFLAYRILYFINIHNRVELNDLLASLTPADKEHPAVKNALEIRSSLALGNYHKFFRLYLDVPNMGAYLMDKFVGRERIAAMAKICRSYKPDVSIRFITEELGFESDEESCRFLLEHVDAGLLQEHDCGVKFLTKPAGPVFEQAKVNAFGVVDIKGQL